ncbi:MAG TPA: CpcT/CpeT family chromophore lyase [Steroidobacteraceae bacterium]|nr:CpcT/CpeT family chromophore lyase [Steroidobacteraceae bacterium]
MASASEQDDLAQLWAGMYDMSEELVAGSESESPLVPVLEQQRIQINVRRVQLPWLGSHVLYVEEFPFDQPFESRRRVLLSIETERAKDGSIRVRQFTRKSDGAGSADLTAAALESEPGCDLYLKRDGAQFRGGTRHRKCVETGGGEPRWLDYRVVIGDGLFWYRQRKLLVSDNELTEEIAGFPHVDFDEAQLFSCGISWAPPGSRQSPRPLEGVELHDRGGRVRFKTPDAREFLLELHGRDWPLSEGRESLLLILTDRKTDETVGSSWTSLGAARVGLDLGWMSIDCAPVVSQTGEQRS